MQAIFNVFHVCQLKKCLRVPEEQIRVENVELKSDLTYEDKPIRIVDTNERVTCSKVIRFFKVVWNNQDERDATWKREDYLKEVYPIFYKNWYYS
jgi:hypothetical protein